MTRRFVSAQVSIERPDADPLAVRLQLLVTGKAELGDVKVTVGGRSASVPLNDQKVSSIALLIYRDHHLYCS